MGGPAPRAQGSSSLLAKLKEPQHPLQVQMASEVIAGVRAAVVGATSVDAGLITLPADGTVDGVLGKDGGRAATAPATALVTAPGTNAIMGEGSAGGRGGIGGALADSSGGGSGSGGVGSAVADSSGGDGGVGSSDETDRSKPRSPSRATAPPEESIDAVDRRE
ncbi:hypothetical protein MMPV_000077 [Pyropia vietnamensis]